MGVRLLTTSPAHLGKPVGLAAREAALATDAEQEDVQREKILEADPRADQEELLIRLVALRDDGYRPGEISEILGREGLEISPQKIGRLLASEAAST